MGEPSIFTGAETGRDLVVFQVRARVFPELIAVIHGALQEILLNHLWRLNVGVLVIVKAGVEHPRAVQARLRQLPQAVPRVVRRDHEIINEAGRHVDLVVGPRFREILLSKFISRRWGYNDSENGSDVEYFSHNVFSI